MMAKNVECMLNEYKQYTAKSTNSNINKAKCTPTKAGGKEEV